MRKLIFILLLSTAGLLTAQNAQVTFRVDMSEYTGTYDTVYLNGTFNNWCGSCAPLADPDGDDVWELAATLPQGLIEYKFTVDGWNDDETLAPGLPCTMTTGGFTNRYLNVSTDTILPVVCWESCDTCNGVVSSGQVTFQVDMSEYPGSYTNVCLNGTFNGWCGSCNTMSDADGDSIWDITLTLPTDTIEYKFTLDGWVGQESLTPGSSCTQTTSGFTNRIFVVPGDTVLAPVCWESCFPCGVTPDTAMVTFKVDLSQYSGQSYDTAYLNGTFNGWCGSCTPMSDANGDSIWEVTVPVLHGGIEYKFTLDGWNIDESLSSGLPCTQTTGGFTNRFMIVSGDTTLAPVCWESCDPCPNLQDTAQVTFSLDVSQFANPPDTVSVSGDFNNWCTTCDMMADPDGDGIWEISMDLPHGAIEYKFTHGSAPVWENLQPGMSCVITTGGYTNRFLTVSGDTVIGPVCWESCAPCPPPPDTAMVTFKVDMRKYSGTYSGVYVNGTYNNWCGTCNPMTDADGDSIWELALPIPEGQIEFKYTLDGWNVEENLTQGSHCTVTTGSVINRFLDITGDTVLPAVCWESCDSCIFNPPGTNLVTFRVDLNEYPDTFSTVYVNGDFNGWCGSCNPMFDPDGDNVWELSIPLTADSIEFKYTLNGWTVEENLSPGMACTKTSGQFTNRFLEISGDTSLPVVCWESCDPCASTPVTKTVTFRVDMNEYSGSYTQVHLNGDFNNWCGSCAPMDDSDGDNIWELAVDFQVDSIEWKFTLDGWTNQEEFLPGAPCTKTTDIYTNRFLIFSGDTVLPAYCWESCSPCPTGMNNNEIFSSVRVIPNPSDGSFILDIVLRETAGLDIDILDIQGRRVFSTKTTGSELTLPINLAGLRQGLYLLRMGTGSAMITRKISILH